MYLKFSFCIFLTTIFTVQAATLQNKTTISVTESEKTNQTQTRIAGGSVAYPKQFPWHVQTEAHISSTSFIRCGGALINPKWVLTSAACVIRSSATNVKVYYGSINQNQMNVIGVERTYIHAAFNSFTHKNDIALLELHGYVTLSSTVDVIRLPAYNDVDRNMTDRTATVSGFGIGSYLQYLKTTTISNKKCSEIFPYNIFESTLCSVANTGSEICQGDGGSALTYLENDGIATQIGITSFMYDYSCINGQSSGQPSGYTRVTEYLKWINDMSGLHIRAESSNDCSCVGNNVLLVFLPIIFIVYNL